MNPLKRRLETDAEDATVVRAGGQDVEERVEHRRFHIAKHQDESDVPKSETIALTIQSNPTVLAIPQKEDNLIVLCSKLVAIADKVTAGHSIAVVTGYLAAANQERRAIQAAVNQMPPLEAEMWAFFKQGSCRLPDMNWKINIDSTPSSPKPLKIARRRAEALNRIYKTDQAQPCHSVWFTKHHLEYLPLVKAMARVIGAE